MFEVFKFHVRCPLEWSILGCRSSAVFDARIYCPSRNLQQFGNLHLLLSLWIGDNHSFCIHAACKVIGLGCSSQLMQHKSCKTPKNLQRLVASIDLTNIFQSKSPGPENNECSIRKLAHKSHKMSVRPTLDKPNKTQRNMLAKPSDDDWTSKDTTTVALNILFSTVI